MKIFLDNVNLGYNSGPNNFALKLFNALGRRGIQCTQDIKDRFDIKLSFIKEASSTKRKPLIQRLDGIYFDLNKNNALYNKDIKDTYYRADGVIFQSNYSKKLVFKHFGQVDNFTVITNGADLDRQRSLANIKIDGLDDTSKIWCCAAHWRPFKRLSENIRYFLEFSSPKDILIVAGKPCGNERLEHERIKYLGNVNTHVLLSIFNISDNFIHLGRYDSCPNVVVEARAAGCNIICCSNGGTREVAGPDATVIIDEPWDYDLVDLNNTPRLDFSKREKNNIHSNIDIDVVAGQYLNFLRGFCD